MILHGYFRSSAAYRVRIALNLKGVDYEQKFVHLRNNDQNLEQFRNLNPQGLVPVLEDSGTVISQSMAIIEYLNEVHPTPSLLPGSLEERAYVRSISMAIACDVHPLNNLRVLRYLDYNFELSQCQRNEWYQHWIKVELTALEAKLTAYGNNGCFCFGDSPTVADVCLVPQMSNARRFNCDLEDYPNLVQIDSSLRQLEAFEKAAPENQPDAE